MSSLEWSTPSGSIGIVTEGSIYSFFFAYDMVPTGDVFIVAGTLPDGLSFDSSNASIVGTIGLIDQTTTYPFTVRIQNELGVKDRSFYLTVNNATPTWITPEELVQNNSENFRTKMYIEKQLEIYNPTNQTPIFEMIGGNLPEGLQLRKDGRLVGYVPAEAGSYTFTAKVVGITKTFHITILNDNEDRPPFWSTINGLIGDANSGTEFQFNLSGADANGESLIFTLYPEDSLPDGLSLFGSLISGNISPNEIGNKFFRLNISDGNSIITRTFYIRANLGDNPDVNFDIAISPFLSVDGNSILEQDEPSYFGITAFQQIGNWIRYELISGNLPSGFKLDIVNGQIQGVTTDIGTYNFVIKCYNDLEIEATLSFSITIKARFEYNPNKVLAIISGYDRQKLNELYISDIIPYDMIYRPGDKNFGITLTNEVLIHKYISSTKQEIYNLLEDRIGSTANPIKFKHVPVQNSFGKVICEAVILVFKDSAREGLETFSINGSTIRITSLDLLREKLTTILTNPASGFVNWQSEYYVPDITNDSFIVSNHDSYTGKVVYFKSQDLPSPFLNDTVYYAIVVDDNTIKLATTKEDAIAGNYVRFNVNEVSRNGALFTPHTAIPFVFCNTGFGERVADAMNSLSYSDITLYFKHFVYGPTAPETQEDLELVWFENQRI